MKLSYTDNRRVEMENCARKRVHERDKRNLVRRCFERKSRELKGEDHFAHVLTLATRPL